VTKADHSLNQALTPDVADGSGCVTRSLLYWSYVSKATKRKQDCSDQEDVQVYGNEDYRPDERRHNTEMPYAALDLAKQCVQHTQQDCKTGSLDGSQTLWSLSDALPNSLMFYGKQKHLMCIREPSDVKYKRS
jgi:hypothetical protein